MISLLFSLLVALHAIPTAFVQCGLTQTTNIFHTETSEHNLSTLQYVNRFSFVQDSTSTGIVDTIDEAKKLPPVANITPYAAFFRKSEVIKATTKNEGVKHVADKVISLIATLSPRSELWGNWLGRNEDTVDDCIKLAIEAFDSDASCNEKERTWIVGILAAILRYMPPETEGEQMTAREKIGRMPWSNQVILEIQAATRFDSYMTKRFESLWLGDNHISEEEISKELEELLQRSKLFNQYDSTREEKFPCLLTTIYEPISKHLLRSKLPDNEKEVSKLIIDFKDFFKNTNLSEWEGEYSEAIFQHILSHSPQAQKTFISLLQGYSFFRQIHFPFAKKDMIEYLKNYPEVDKLGEYVQKIEGWHEEKTLGPTSEAGGHELLNRVYNHMDSQKDEKFSLEHDKFLAAFHLIFPRQEKELYDSIQKNPWLSRPKLSLHVWSKLYPSGRVPDANFKFGEYRWMLPIKTPVFLSEAVRHKLMTMMQDSKEKNIKELGKLFDYGSPRIKRVSDDYYDQVVKALQEAQKYPSANEVYVVSLELIYYLVSFEYGYAKRFVYKMKDSDKFRTTIQKASKFVRKVRKSAPLEEGIPLLSTSQFDEFLNKVENMFKVDQLNGQGSDIVIEHLTKELEFKGHDFHLIVQGQPVRFKFAALD
ncbi:hypothetical protein DFH28DRAFT_987117 [Melampsora americana]|nr:hypothetical protein DFH28DRAFT_987117 [Melampsora americana]